MIQLFVCLLEDKIKVKDIVRARVTALPVSMLSLTVVPTVRWDAPEWTELGVDVSPPSAVDRSLCTTASFPSGWTVEYIGTGDVLYRDPLGLVRVRGAFKTDIHDSYASVWFIPKEDAIAAKNLELKDQKDQEVRQQQAEAIVKQYIKEGKASSFWNRNDYTYLVFAHEDRRAQHVEIYQGAEARAPHPSMTDNHLFICFTGTENDAETLANALESLKTAPWIHVPTGARGFQKVGSYNWSVRYIVLPEGPSKLPIGYLKHMFER